METPILTPMQQAIELLKKLKQGQIDIDTKYNGDSEYVKGKIKAYKEAIEALQNHLPKEQEAIEQAYNAGCDMLLYPATEYFNQTYKDNE